MENRDTAYLIDLQFAGAFVNCKIWAHDASVNVNADAWRGAQKCRAHTICLMPGVHKGGQGAKLGEHESVIKLQTKRSAGFLIGVHDMCRVCSAHAFFPLHLKYRSLQHLQPNLNKLRRVLLRDREVVASDLIPSPPMHDIAEKLLRSQIHGCLSGSQQKSHDVMALESPHCRFIATQGQHSPKQGVCSSVAKAPNVRIDEYHLRDSIKKLLLRKNHFSCLGCGILCPLVLLFPLPWPLGGFRPRLCSRLAAREL